MKQMTVAQRMTAAEFLAQPEPEHGWPLNLVDGEVVMNEPTVRHGRPQLRILFALESWVRAEPGRGEVGLPRDIQLDDRNVFKPDVVWYAEGRVPDLDDRAPYAMADLAVEVRSPSTWRYDVGAKKVGYERHGLAELWLVDTVAEAVRVFRRSTAGGPSFDVALELDREQRLGSPLLPGFALEVGELFPRG